jgi:LacI family transcriptional regulator
MKQSTIRDVAESAGVSVAAVSRVLNDGPVAEATRARVLAAIDELDYRPRTAARELRSQSQSTLGLVLADLANPFFAQLADLIVWEARARGAQVVMLTTREDATFEDDAIRALLSRRVAGVIATPTAENSPAWSRLSEAGSRLVFVDRSVEGVSADIVRIDNETISHEATSRLLQMGHTRIGIVAGPQGSSTGRERVEGYRRAFAERGLDVDDALVRFVPFRGEQGADAVGALLGMNDPMTALLIANTAQSTVCARRLRMGGIDIPGQLSVVAFGDEPWTELHDPPISIVRQPVSMLATHAVELALRDAGEPVELRVAAEYVERASVARR